MRPVCVIVGAGPGLGSALAAKFASQGFDIALISRTEANSAAAIGAAQAASSDVAVQFHAADATKPESLEAALATVAEDMGETEVLIYNARGHFTACAPLEMSYNALEEVFSD